MAAGTGMSSADTGIRLVLSTFFFPTSELVLQLDQGRREQIPTFNPSASQANG
jgi:hypothetical protein